MAGLLEFVREWMDIRREARTYCKSCEILREQLATANFEKKQLLDKLLYVPPPVSEIPTDLPKPIIPKIVPWKLQREHLEAEDRAKAATLRRLEEERLSARKPTHSAEISVEQLEKELGVE